jgi:hypothetical protein
MAQILALKLKTEEQRGDDIERPRYKRLRRQSRFLSTMITALLVLYVVYHAAMVVATPLINGDGVHLGPGAHVIFDLSAPKEGPPGSVLLSSFSVLQRIGFALVLALRAVPIGLTLFNLRALFRLYASGIVFARENASHIKRMGIWLIVFAATPYVTHELSVPMGNNFDDEWFHMEEVYALVGGAVVYVVAQVMQVGREIEQERDEFV